MRRYRVKTTGRSPYSIGLQAGLLVGPSRMPVQYMQLGTCTHLQHGSTLLSTASRLKLGSTFMWAAAYHAEIEGPLQVCVMSLPLYGWLFVYIYAACTIYKQPIAYPLSLGLRDRAFLINHLRGLFHCECMTEAAVTALVLSFSLARRSLGSIQAGQPLKPRTCTYDDALRT